MLASFMPPWLEIAAAHEIGTTRVAIWISADRYRAQIVTDAQALADKLAVAGKEKPNEALGSPEQARAFGERFRDRVTLLLDGSGSCCPRRP